MKGRTKTNHSKTDLRYHLITIPKYRRPRIKNHIAKIIAETIEIIAKEYKFEIIQSAYEKDHIHIYYQARPDQAPSKTISVIKAKTSKEIKKLDPEFQWARGYYLRTVGTGGKNLEEYIKNQ